MAHVLSADSIEKSALGETGRDVGCLSALGKSPAWMSLPFDQLKPLPSRSGAWIQITSNEELLSSRRVCVCVCVCVCLLLQDGDYFNDVYKYEIATSMWGSVCDLLFASMLGSGLCLISPLSGEIMHHSQATAGLSTGRQK